MKDIFHGMFALFATGIYVKTHIIQKIIGEEPLIEKTPEEEFDFRRDFQMPDPSKVAFIIQILRSSMLRVIDKLTVTATTKDTINSDLPNSGP